MLSLGRGAGEGVADFDSQCLSCVVDFAYALSFIDPEKTKMRLSIINAIISAYQFAHIGNGCRSRPWESKPPEAP